MHCGHGTLFGLLQQGRMAGRCDTLCKCVVAWGLTVAVFSGLLGPALAEDPKTLAPTAIELKSEPCGDGWTRWDSIGNAEGVVTYRERITALAANQDDIWVGTSYGRLLTRQEDKWTLQGRLDGIQITGIALENAGKVWLSTSDGIRRLERDADEPWRSLVRLNAQARKYHNREPEKNKKDGTEFSFVGPEQVGCEFDRVADLAAATDKGVWAVLTSRENGSALARFDGQSWVTHPLDGPARCVAEVEPGVVLIGVDGSEWGRYHGLRKVTWASKKIERPVGPEGVIHKIVRLTNGRVLAASWWSLFESDSTVKKAPAE